MTSGSGRDSPILLVPSRTVESVFSNPAALIILLLLSDVKQFGGYYDNIDSRTFTTKPPFVEFRGTL
ncbi:hypothetical protein CEXT_465541 [Caerostris extrusa]|uniref:Uncharacterized protein n=1 Tax=Caerostris extrusa TaxID=172846 RepID=A0AAV4NUC4_CAEEX|nr:hypothetical protein CEXT_465541 [Caerostris extrusa]